ncbi:hypothetical protein BFP97_09395 [Roseivirga sp. 4D4]|uniref:DUF983 domain-containing protein n=1 Tax=Roseivirga sp. 4D4 TaxID=1889784 RepID=UPI000852F01D|nr:DUF983 domain-containing protein [Roseivirga sp. 4D4]OEK01716.1 hypothetical protein BFP97_09395 [Roseivirga sp. 4D4]
MSKKPKGLAVLQGKCPQCHQGDLFTHGAYNLRNFTKVNEHCSHCGVRFEREPRFFDGAMYISYALSVGLFLVSAFIIYMLFHPVSENVYLIAIISEVFLLYPLMFRYSRIFYLYIFGGLKFQPELEEKENN